MRIASFEAMILRQTGGLPAPGLIWRSQASQFLFMIRNDRLFDVISAAMLTVLVSFGEVGAKLIGGSSSVLTTPMSKRNTELTEPSQKNVPAYL